MPRPVRSSTSPVAVHRDVGEALEALRGAGLLLIGADGHAERDLDEVIDAGALGVPTAWVFGNEAHGLDPSARDLLDDSRQHPDPRTGGEPQPRDRGGGVPLRQRPRPPHRGARW